VNRPVSQNDIENARLELLGVRALLDVLCSGASASLNVVLTRGALVLLCAALKWLGEENAQNLSWPGTLDAACARLARRETS